MTSKSSKTLESLENSRTNSLQNQSKELFLIFYITGYVKHDGLDDKMFHEASQTRINNIKHAKNFNPEIHKVHSIPIQDLAEMRETILRYINKYGGKNYAYTKEIGIFSHSGKEDGPIGSQDTTQYKHLIYRDQMSLEGYTSIDFNWITNSTKRFIVYGCNSAYPSNPFIKKLSMHPNFRNVELWGQTTYSFPSFYPNKRSSSIIRQFWKSGFDIAEKGTSYTYMVGGNDGEGLEAIFTKTANINPMAVYINGKKTQEPYQNKFNDHTIADEIYLN
ncbi:MAG: hypothetical protein RI964_2147 [Pseudomonadota bacterium]|jgi:hypothetical protein